jgi:hypothetical protein
MNKSLQYPAEELQDLYGLRLAARLSAGANDLPHDISERLRVARQQAIANRKVIRVNQTRTASHLIRQGATASLSFKDEGLNLWSRMASALPLITLVAGLVAIHMIQNDNRANEVAEVDAALLTDDLPPSAYIDPGFVQYLKSASNHTPSR